MRKRLIGQAGSTPETSERRWLDLERIAEIEVTSEAPGYQVDSAVALENRGQGWRAERPGEQLLRIVFDTPIAIHRIRLHFVESEKARTQEFVLRWAGGRREPSREIVRQQWNFSPSGAVREIEDYRVDLEHVCELELAIVPDRSGAPAHASLTGWRMA